MRQLRALALYAVLTAVLTYPLIFRLRMVTAGDSAFFAWAVGWVVHALKTDPWQLPHGNIYHPLQYALGMDEPILGTTLLVLPLAPFTDDAVLLANVARLLTFVLSGFTAYLLARDLRCGEGPALFAGAAFAFSPIRTDQLTHFSTLGTQWLPLVLLFMHRFFREGRLRNALAAAVFFAVSAAACGYHAVFALLVLPAAAVPLLWGRWRRVPGALMAAAVAGILLLPLYLMHRTALDPEGHSRSREETIIFSASLETFLSASPWNRIYGGATERFRSAANNLFPGLVPPALVVFGAIRLWRRRVPPTRDALALAALGTAAVLVALGPEVRLQGETLFAGPFSLAREAFSVFRMIRVTSRAGIFLALALAVLSAKVLADWRPRKGVWALVAVVALAETLVIPLPKPIQAYAIDTRRPPRPLTAWLAQQPSDTVVVELPMQELSRMLDRPKYNDSAYIVRSTRHWRRLVNGYAGIDPAHYRHLRDLTQGFPSEASIAAFRVVGVRYVVLHRRGYGPYKRERIGRELKRFGRSLRWVAEFPPGDQVFELLPAEAHEVVHTDAVTTSPSRASPEGPLESAGGS